MNTKILEKSVQDYINANLNSDLHSLLLKKSPFEDVSSLELVQQIQGRKIALKKFPFLDRSDILFPPHLNLEQSSSEATARYKSRILKGESFADLTSGFGVDAYYFAQKFSSITLNDLDQSLLEIVKYNWSILQQDAKFNSSKIEDFILNEDKNFDAIYFDPARRDSAKKKVFLLEDLSPNILEIQDQLLKRAPQILIKLSPLIDLHYLKNELRNLAEIHIVGVRNEVKEVLVFLKRNAPDSTRIVCVNLETLEPNFEFEIGEEKVDASFSEVQEYLCIPNNSILKSGAFNLVSKQFGIQKLHQNTQLFTSNQYINDFPGRVLKVEKINGKDLKKGEKFNIISKNYPLKPEEIKKKYKLQDGGENYLIAIQDSSGKILLKSTK